MKDKVLKNMELDDFLKETKIKTFKPLLISILVGLIGLTMGLILLKFNWTVSGFTIIVVAVSVSIAVPWFHRG